MAISTYALTSVADAKTYMRVTASTDDALIAELVNAATAFIERICGRQFKARDYRYWHNGVGQRRLVLKHPPIQTINRIGYGAAEALRVTYTGSGIRATCGVYQTSDTEAYNADTGGAVRLVSYASTGVKTTTNVAYTSYDSVSELATQISTISGWTGTAVTNVPAGDLYVTGMENALNRSVTLYYPDESFDSYNVDRLRGIVTFDNHDFPWGFASESHRFPKAHQGVLVEYNAGYTVIPVDLVRACWELTKDYYYNGRHDTALGGYSIGPYSVSFSQQAEDKVRQRLAPYMDATAYIASVS